MSKAQDKAYDYIKDQIFAGNFVPGYHLKEEDLADACDVSRTPVRQAIRQLADEGLVTIKSTGRSHVVDVSDEHVDEVYDIIRMLESYSAGLSALRATEDDIAELKAIEAELENLKDYDADNHRAFLEINSRFHKKVHQINNNPRLYDLIQRVVDLPQGFYLKMEQPTENETAIDHHRRIITAIEAGDRELAAMHMALHIETVRREFAVLRARAR